MVAYNRTYLASQLQRRFAVFSANLDQIEQHNADLASSGLTYTLGITSNADLSPDEYRTQRLGYRRPARSLDAPPPPCDASTYSSFAPLASLDWRGAGAVGVVKDQGQCGACWSFAATGSIEALWFLRKGELLSLSEQQLLDCSGAEGDEGCSGGYTNSALQYVQDAGGICSEAEYSYVGYQDDDCHDECSPVASITAHSCVDSMNETALLRAVTAQPVAVAVEADQPVFQHYSGGIIDDARCGSNLDHAVLIIGYGTDPASHVDYWIVKNSWSSRWGQGGYALMRRGKNMCGLAMEPVLPTLIKSAD